MGITEVFTFGPICESGRIGSNGTSECTCSYNKMDYSEGLIKKVIDKYLNNPKLCIKYVENISKDEALDTCVNIIDIMR